MLPLLSFPAGKPCCRNFYHTSVDKKVPDICVAGAYCDTVPGTNSTICKQVRSTAVRSTPDCAQGRLDCADCSGVLPMAMQNAPDCGLEGKPCCVASNAASTLNGCK